MFDRLVCMNGGNPREDLIAHKDPEKAMALEHSSLMGRAEPKPSVSDCSMEHTSSRVR